MKHAIETNDIYWAEADWDTKPDAKKLIQSILVKNPKQRPSCDQILSHMWISKHMKDKGSKISAKVLDSIRKYGNMQKLKKTAVQVVAMRLPPNEIESLRKAFLDFDEDNSGTISVDEFQKGMQKIGLASDDIKALFAKIDTDSTGLISYSEFIAAAVLNSEILSVSRLARAFEGLDPDGSGFIELAELHGILVGFTEEQTKEIISKCEEGSSSVDGKIGKDEFLELVRDVIV